MERLAKMLRAEAEHLAGLLTTAEEDRTLLRSVPEGDPGMVRWKAEWVELRGRVLELDRLEESLFVNELLGREESGSIRRVLDPLCRRLYERRRRT